MDGRERERKKEREREKEQNEKIPDPSIHLSHPSHSIPSIYCLFLFVCLLLFLLPGFSSFFLPYLTLRYYTAVYLDRFLRFELELEVR